MKRLIFFLVLLCLPICYAIKQCGTLYCADYVVNPSRNNIVFNPITGNTSKGHLYSIPEEVVITTAPGGGGGGYTTVSTIYYDVIIDVEKLSYARGEEVSANVTIINKGYTPDRDGTLQIWLSDPKKKVYMKKSTTFELIPPTCQKGIYDRYNDVCTLPDGSNTTSYKKVITVKSILPTDAQLGEWDFNVQYESNIQPIVTGYDPFYVVDRNPLLFLLIIGLGFVIAKRWRDKDDNPKSKRIHQKMERKEGQGQPLFQEEKSYV